jgi:hypothetical protein
MELLTFRNASLGEVSEENMQRSFHALLLVGALVGSSGAAWAQSTHDSANPPASVSPLPGFSSQDPRPGASGSSPASSGSNVGSNVGAGASASPVNNDPITPTTLAPETAEAPKTRPLFGLSQDFAAPPAPVR